MSLSIIIWFPTSEVVDYESRVKALLGVKHGSTKDQLDIPFSEIARRIGFGNYKKLRLLSATEDENYPELESPEDQEMQQEKKIEPKPKPKRRQL